MGHTHPYSDVCGDTHIPRDACAGHTLPGETRITMTPVTVRVP